MRRAWRVAAVIAAMQLVTPAAHAAPATVEVLPAKSLLSADHRTSVRVVVSNPSDHPLRRVRVRPLLAGTRGLELDVVPDELRQIKPGSTRTWRLIVKAPGAAAEERALEVVARFTTRGTGGRSSGVAHASAVFVPAPVPDPAKVASMELAAALETIRSGKEETVYLLLHNKSAVPIQPGEVEPRSPSFLSVTGGSSIEQVAPGDTRVIPLTVKADDRVRPGKHQLVFSLPVTPKGGTPVTVTAEKAVSVSVSGESEVLSPLGIPALFVLPGFLALATMNLLWTFRALRKQWDAEPFPFEIKSERFWVIAVSASLALTLVMSHGLGIDLFDQYGLDDIGIVWFASCVAGATVYVIWVLLRNENRESRVPSTSDSPIEVLEKLHKQRLTVVRERFAYDTGTNGSKLLYALQEPDPARPATWMSPAIDFSWTLADEELRKQIEQSLETTRDAGSLATLLKQGRAAGKLKLDWAADSKPVTGPRLVEKDKIGAASGPDVLVHEE